jgi:CheY-like chemotaxis protein
MGGRLWFESELGRGSTFHVELDLAPDPAGDAVELGEAAELGGLRVLVVHRDAGTQERLCGMLSDLHLEGTPTDQPSRVPQLLREAQASGRPFGLILLDRHIRGAAALLARHPGDDRLVSQLPQVLLSSDASGASAGRIGTAPMLLGSPTPRELLGAVREALEAEARRPPSAGSGPGTEPESRPLRVLVAEDNPVNAFMTVRMLELLGHTSQVVEDGARAVAAVESDGFDAVLMDVQMPGMDGLEATRRIRARERDQGGRRVRVVALTANAMKGDAERCLAAGADAYLAKPFELETLRAVLAGNEPAAPSPGSAGTLDLPRLEALLGGDPEGVAQVLDTFQAQLPGYFARVREGVVAGNARAVEQAAHKLKGALLWITADSAAETASLLERLGTSGELTGAAEAVADLERKLTIVRDAISRSRATSAEDRA